MISPGDEYPLHQTSRPVRDPGTDRNLYDRFFFNGYPHAGEDRGRVFFAVALGTYPGRNLVDAAFSVIVDGTQHNVRASRVMGSDRLDLRCETVSVEIVTPLQELRVRVDDPEAGVSADLRFRARAVPFEEPHYRHAPGYRTVMDITRMTQNGTWHGEIRAGGRVIEVDDDRWWGVRDRSWGIRLLGERESGAPDGGPGAGFYWLWAPLNFDDEVVLFDVNELPDGRRWHDHAAVAPVGPSTGPDARPTDAGTHTYEITWKSGTRHASEFSMALVLGSGRTEKISLRPLLTFFMSGIGYTHPTWGHGMWIGDHVHSHDALDLASVNEGELLYNHVQILCEATRTSDGGVGMGVLEMMIAGPHAPSGFSAGFDLAR